MKPPCFLWNLVFKPSLISCQIHLYSHAPSHNNQKCRKKSHISIPVPNRLSTHLAAWVTCGGRKRGSILGVCNDCQNLETRDNISAFHRNVHYVEKPVVVLQRVTPPTSVGCDVSGQPWSCSCTEFFQQWYYLIRKKCVYSKAWRIIYFITSPIEKFFVFV